MKRKCIVTLLLLVMCGAAPQFASADKVTYTYDDAGRLLRASYASGVVIVYTYDAAGNLLNRVVTSPIVANPAPGLTSVSPSSTAAGGAAFTLTVTGTNFISSSVVQWNASARTTTFASSTQLTAAITAADIATAGTAKVTVFNPTPGGGTSSPLTFTINPPANPAPTISSLAPSSTTAGGAAFTLTVTGTNFISSSVVQWNASARTTTFTSSTQLTAAITVADIATAGTAQVTVVNPAPGGGTSVPLTFTINSAGPPPTINPGGLVSGASFSNLPSAAASIVTLFGANFASSLVVATSLPLPTSLGGVSVQVKAVPASQSAITTQAINPANGTVVPLFAVSPNQINFQMPPELQGATQATIIVTVNNVPSNPLTVSLTTFSPGLFATNQQGSGQGAILIASTGEVVAPSGSIPGAAARPANRGEYITIYCTGLGPVTNQPAAGVAASSNPLSLTTTNPTITLGGVPVPTTDGFFSGLAPTFVGLYQVNMQVPQNSPTGDAVQLVLSIGGVASNTVTIAVQ